MIRVCSPVLFVDRKNLSNSRTINSEELADFLYRCTKEAGVYDSDLIWDLIRVLEHLVQEKGPLDTEEGAKLVYKIFTEAGLIHLAEIVRKQWYCPVSLDSDPQTTVGVTEQEIIGLLQEEPFFQYKPILGLARLTSSQLRRLKFQKVSRSFALALAKENWFQLSQTRPNTFSYWIISREEIPTFLEDMQKNWFHAGILGFRSISGLFPTITIEFFCRELERQYPDITTGELFSFSIWENIGSELVTWIQAITEEINHRLKQPPTTIWPIRLIFKEIHYLFGPGELASPNGINLHPQWNWIKKNLTKRFPHHELRILTS